MPKRCLEAHKEIAAGREAEPDLQQVEITEQHTLYRCLLTGDLDPSDKSLTLPGAFERHDLSVYAIGQNLPALDPRTLVQLKPQYVGTAEIPASLFSDKNRFKLDIVHDPYRDLNGYQHPNHVRIICTKGVTVCKDIMRAAKRWEPE